MRPNVEVSIRISPRLHLGFDDAVQGSCPKVNDSLAGNIFFRSATHAEILHLGAKQLWLRMSVRYQLIRNDFDARFGPVHEY